MIVYCTPVQVLYLNYNVLLKITFSLFQNSFPYWSGNLASRHKQFQHISSQHAVYSLFTIKSTDEPQYLRWEHNCCHDQQLVSLACVPGMDSDGRLIWRGDLTKICDIRSSIFKLTFVKWTSLRLTDQITELAEK